MAKETKELKVKETDHCVKCGGILKAYSLGGGDIFNFTGTSRGAYYCEDNECDLFGVLTLARMKKTEKAEATT